MKCYTITVFGLLILCLIVGCCGEQAGDYAFDPAIAAENVIFSGVRSSSYGINPFPEPRGWHVAMSEMVKYFPGSTPCAIWIVGKLERPKSCLLEFPSEGKKYENIVFIEDDKHESFLDYFDQAGIKVFLQVEPAHADVGELIDLVLGRYKHHECVIGFGIDVEWYQEFDNPGWGVKVEDHLAEIWEARVKGHNKSYRLFLKHWDRNWMPPEYRGDIVFVDDSQMLKDFNSMLDEFVSYWSDHFWPNTVFFQIGYPSDKPWWEKLDLPPKSIGQAIAQNIKQECGVFWVDFTLLDVLPISNERDLSQ
jgi:hypothetical protein